MHFVPFSQFGSHNNYIDEFRDYFEYIYISLAQSPLSIPAVVSISRAIAKRERADRHYKEERQGDTRLQRGRSSRVTK